MRGGGRVTELAARPLINLFYPELSGLVQPLAGEYGGRRSLLEQLPFCSGYGVEIGLLIDTLEKNKADLVSIQPALREFSGAGLYKAYDIPYHPGALKYFKEHNIQAKSVQ